LRLAGDTDLVRNEVEAVCATTVGNWGISASNLKEIRFPLPPLAEQHRIVTKVDELMALCDRLEASLATSDDTRRRLLDALLHEALAPVDDREMEEKPPMRTAGGSGQAASLAAFGFQLQGRS
jgi:type I restriction enzyme S subunit